MVTFGLLAIVLLVLVGSGFLALSRCWTVEKAFGRLSWIPLAALLLELLFFPWLGRTLSYAAVAVPVLTCIVSLALTMIGLTLVVSARERGERRPRLLAATAVAAIPGALFVGYILYAVAAQWLGGA